MSKTVLIVDDVELSREILKNAVSSAKQKNTVQFAENAFDAMKKIQGISFDLIIMDIMMPNGDGFELLSMMSHHGVTSKIIITSGLDKSIVSSASMLGKLYELDVVASLEKPIWAEQITQLVDKTFADTDADFTTKKPINGLTKIIDDDFPINLVYQPQVVSDINVTSGFEILSRWSDESGALLPPSYFLPVIEELGKQKVFTSIVIKKFEQDYYQYFSKLDKSLRFSINIEPDLLVDEMIVEQLLDLYNKGVEHKVVIEMTEQSLTDNIERELLANVLKLRLNGFEISIDDFGVDASNIERIIKLPINEIKIDKKITLGLAHNIDYMQKLNEVKKLVSVKNARIIYEGIENEETCAFLETIEGYNQQGFYHGVPLLPQAAVEALNKQK
ncbi:EAL domain-containing protein [Aliivibrio finisterrensis]|uniref:EAL domain-containing protein n=1 Tax=Aliivibrio finisterrensis TaxID=511998 RepID=UPI00101ECA40|nr:EAL domain-containing protein [Aliivibrio finisterrensis]RYU68422.1 EAL domain-containing protein [Aliivibrio finisterrensis]RYU72175.1 EAL domain-containing protein [Aliivibrio finisterrensis]RYU75691.1 EAL domain-containing protein [Aliivibrio finisterrensis]